MYIVYHTYIIVLNFYNISLIISKYLRRRSLLGNKTHCNMQIHSTQLRLKCLRNAKTFHGDKDILYLSHTSGDYVTQSQVFFFLTLRLWLNPILLIEICMDNICYLFCNKVLYLFTFRCMSGLPGCIYVHQVCAVPAEAGKGHWSHWNWSYGWLKPPCWCWEPSPGPPPEQKVILTTESALQPSKVQKY